MSQEDFELPSEGDFSVENGSEFSSDESTLSLRFSLMREANLNKAHINYIDIPRNSTYKAATRIINSCIGRLNESLTLLVQNDGPWPCWKSPKPDEKISFQTSTLLAVDGENPFIIALLRTEVEDAPLIIEWWDHASSTGLHLLKTLKEILYGKGLTLRSAQLYGSFETVENRLYDYSVFTKMESFPTTLYLLACSSSISDHSSMDETYQFRTEYKATSSIPIPLQMTLCQSERVMNNTFKLQWMELQCLHIAQSLLHLTVSLVEDGKDGPDVLYTNNELQSIMDVFEAIIETLLHEEDAKTQAPELEENLAQIFHDCCGEFLGAVAVRYSYNIYQKMVRLDRNNFERERFHESSVTFQKHPRSFDDAKILQPVHGIASSQQRDLLPTWHSSEITIEERDSPEVVKGIQQDVGVTQAETPEQSHLYTISSIQPGVVENRQVALSSGVFNKATRGSLTTPIQLPPMRHHDALNLEEEEKVQRESLVHRQSTLGSAHPDTIISMRRLAHTLYRLNRFDEAEAIQRNVLVHYQGMFGSEHADTIMAMHNFGLTLYKLNRLDEAEALQQEVLEFRRRILGPDDPNTIATMHNLAMTFCDRGQLEEAKTMQEKVLVHYRSTLGEKHANTVMAMHSLAHTLYRLDKFGEAEKVQRNVLDHYQSIFGLEHTNTIMAMHALALTLYNLDRLHEAEKLQQEVLVLWRRMFGPDHTNTVTAVHNLALTLFGLHRFHEAEKMQREVLKARQSTLGQEHADTIAAMRNLNHTLYKLGQLDEGQENTERGLGA